MVPNVARLPANRSLEITCGAPIPATAGTALTTVHYSRGKHANLPPATFQTGRCSRLRTVVDLQLPIPPAHGPAMQAPFASSCASCASCAS
jgi:hypothetical protein